MFSAGVKINPQNFSYPLSFPRIAPTMTLHRPIPIICIDVVIPIAVPTTESFTTRGIDGHVDDYNRNNKVNKIKLTF